MDRYIEHNVPIDILVYTPEEVKARLGMNDFFLREIMEKGKILYERGIKSDHGRVDHKSR